MISALDFITDIQKNQIRKMYVFGGTEYGVKEEYLKLLKSHFSSVVETDDIKSVIHSFIQRSLFQIADTLYISRYDTNFLSSLNNDYAHMIDSIKFKGTVVLIYEEESALSKCDKYLKNYTMRVPNMDKNQMLKHLSKDYKVDSTLLKYVCKAADNYAEAKRMADNLSSLESNRQSSMRYDEVLSLFGKDLENSDDLKISVAAKDFKSLVITLDHMDDSTQMIHTIMSTMVDLERAKTSTWKGNYNKYVKLWKVQDIYNMFMNSYSMLILTRQYYNNIRDASLILIELLCWNPVPSLEEFTWN